MSAPFDRWSATHAEALAAQGDAPIQHYGPLYQWNVVQDIAELRAFVEQGNGFAVLDAISRCAGHGLVTPDWCGRRRERASNQPV